MSRPVFVVDAQLSVQFPTRVEAEEYAHYLRDNFYLSLEEDNSAGLVVKSTAQVRKRSVRGGA